MAQFITYYSFKGGVGRTLALANTAWLLANHAMEPARVLVVDFDLAAPGLHRVFKMSKKSSSLGIVDYVTQYLETARVPDISIFIQKTMFPQIDIIPAGKLDRHYQERLEQINWKSVYEKAHGFLLIDAFKRSINNLAQDYDYVLVDSLTGFSDVGGICVKQLADSVVLLFRLNQQNLDGISTVYQSIENVQDIDITPVITPAWPFIDDAAGAWVKKAASIFDKRQILEISFDSGLTFGEKIIARQSKQLTLKPKVIEEYQRLTTHLRAQNVRDPLTIWQSLNSFPGRRNPEARAEAHLSLLRKRPQTLAYWEILPTTLVSINLENSSMRGTWQRRLREYLNEQCKQENKFALFGRAAVVAAQYRHEGSSQLKAVPDLTKAIEIDTKFYDALEMRARLYLSADRPAEAIYDYEILYKNFHSGDERRARIAGELGDIYLSQFNSKQAVTYLSEAFKHGDKTLGTTRALAQALYLDGNYEAAIAQARRYGSLYVDDEPMALLPAQILAAMGRSTEALEELRHAQRRTGSPIEFANLAEAYLAVDPARTITLLQNKKTRISSSTREMLVDVADILLGDDNKSRVHSTDEHSDRKEFIHWNCFEIVAMLFAKRRDNSISRDLALRIIDLVSLKSGTSLVVTLP
jgi:MinD-like ATPase involved in chromosome partitioning or flagellar assembly